MEQDAEKILEYIRQQDGIIVVTRCILMELASQSHSLEECYVRYVKKIADYGIALYVIYEEELQDIMESCFASRQQVNNYLIWAIRMINSPVSTIAKTLRIFTRVFSPGCETIRKQETTLGKKCLRYACMFL